MLDQIFFLSLLVGVSGFFYLCIFRDVRAVTEKELKHIPELRFEGSNASGRYMRETRALLKIGYEKYLRHGVPFQMRNPIGEMGPQVFLPMKYFDEVKRAPKSLFSFNVFSEKAFLLNYSHAPHQTDAATAVIKDDVNKNLAILVDGIWNEAVAGLEENTSSDWTSTFAYAYICDIVARTMSFVLVGPQLCRNREWQRIVIEATYAVFGATNVIREKYTPRWRWLAYWSNSTQAQLKQIRTQATELLKLHYKARQEATMGFKTNGSSLQLFQDTVYWLLGRKNADTSLAGIVDQELFLSMTSIHTTSGTLNSILFDWLAHPEYHEEIKAEVNETLTKVKADGKWTLQHVARMKKLDSFMKESSRVNPIGFVTLQRYTLKPHVFKDGLRIPAGTTVLFGADGVHYDANNYPDPDKFDGYRFLRLRETVDTNRFHYASVSNTMLNFGGGPHACPGRFVSALVIKFVLIQLMTRYEVMFDDRSTQRPPDDHNHNNLRPDTNVKIQVRKLDLE